MIPHTSYESLRIHDMRFAYRRGGRGGTPNVEAARKHQLKVEMQRRACVAYRTLTPEDAAKVLADEQHEITDD